MEYQSARLQDEESEYVVRSGHSGQVDPHTIAEVRRILLEQLKQERIAEKQKTDAAPDILIKIAGARIPGFYETMIVVSAKCISQILAEIMIPFRR